jgi:hypothetical protein
MNDRLRRTRRWALAVCAFLPATAGTAQVKIREPAADSLTTSTNISVRGTVAGGANVSLQVGPSIRTTGSSNGVWSLDEVELPETLNRLTARAGIRKHDVLVTSVANMTVRPPQVVVLKWEAAAIEKLKQIAVVTRQPPSEEDEQNAFVQAVPLKTQTLIAASFAPYAINVVAQSNRADVHVVTFSGMSNGSTYGTTPGVDCGNSNPSGVSTIWVGTLLDKMSNVAAWAPMMKSDSLYDRINDVAHALAYTATHEIGHGLGLVVSSTGSVCGWMRGCGDHNCQLFDTNQVGADRWDNGRYIMDPSAPANVRIGHSSRTKPRVQAGFNRITADYLELIHPLL